ncbi:MAG: hypothetical protein FD170_4003 [Bacteroidetes bacterium]|nr:MAG: hypothetical protein FD170_4003 [Bacteroidota bacterium]
MDTKQIELSIAELEAMLAEKKKQDRIAKLKARESYEAGRDELVSQLVARAKVLNDQMRDFKQYAIDKLEAFRETANDYGDIRKNSKGGFSLRHRSTAEMVSLDRNSVPEYDERAASAESLLKEFLEDKVKKRDLATYRTIMALMERNKQGDLTPSRIASLLKVKDNYDDERWTKAMELFEESFRIREISYSVSFFRKDQMQKDQAIVLTFASIPVTFFRDEVIEDKAPQNER